MSRVPYPSLSNFTAWALAISDALSLRHRISIVSGDPNTSNLTGSIGDFAIDIRASSTTRLWINQSGTTSSWSYVDQL